jgi:hypothetical protein
MELEDAPTPPPVPQGSDDDLTTFDGDMVPKAVFLERLGKSAKQRDEFKAQVAQFQRDYPGISLDRMKGYQQLEQFDQQLGAVLAQDAWMREVLQARMEGRQPDWNMVQEQVSAQMQQAQPSDGQGLGDPNDPYMKEIRAVSARQQNLERQIVERQQQSEVREASAQLDREISEFTTKNPAFNGDREFVMQALARARSDRTTFTVAADALSKWANKQRDSALGALRNDGRRRDGAKPGGPASPAAVPVSERPKIGSPEERAQMMEWAKSQGQRR